MTQQVRDVMTSPPVIVQPQAPVREVARRMREEGIGAVLVADGDQLKGLVTDRDLVVRLLANEGDLSATSVHQACSEELVTLSPDDEVDHAVQLMRDHAVRRLPVVEGDRPVGILSLGDLAIERGAGSALGDISAAESNT
jgi:CBS domain-containing protein